VVFLAAAVVVGYHLLLECESIGLETPMGCPETIYCAVAKAWPHEYQAGHYVEAQDNYGPVYPLLCRPFQVAGLGIYSAARTANLFFIVGATLLLALILWANGCRSDVAVAGCALFYALNAGSYSIQARPDFLAMLATVAVLGFAQPSVMGRMRGFPAGVLLGLLSLVAYLTKPYCLLAWGIGVAFEIGSALVRGQGLRRAGVVTATSAAFIGAGVALFAALNPYFLLETVLFHTSYIDTAFAWLVLQMRDFAAMTCGLWVIAVLGWRKFHFWGAGRLVQAAGQAPAYWLWACGAAMLALILGMGWHQGAYLTYFIHYLLAPLIIVAGLAAGAVPIRWRSVALLVNLWAMMQFAPVLPRPDPGWRSLRRDVLEQPGTVLVDFLMEPMSRERSEIWVAGTGNNWIALDQLNHLHSDFFSIAAARKEAASYVKKCVADIGHGRPPDCIYLDCFPAAVVGPHGQAGYTWVPRNRSPLLDAYNLEQYRRVGLFQIHPYYGSATMPRGDVGKSVAFVVKFVRKSVSPSDFALPTTQPKIGALHQDLGTPRL
jgi:hypothetical protein